MKKVLFLIAMVLLINVKFVFGANPTSFDNVKTVSLQILIEQQGAPDKYKVTTKVKGSAKASNGAMLNEKIQELFNDGQTYTLKQVYTNFDVLSANIKADFKDVVQTLVKDSVE